MADIYRPSLRLRPSEQRTVLLLGDFIASVAGMGGAIFFWYQYSLFRLVESGLKRNVAERIIQIEVPFWFYVLPLVWLLLMIDSYEIHTASNWRKTLRGIAVAPLVGLLGYSLLFTINTDPNSLPRIAIGAFLVLASFLTLGWRAVYIRLYTSSGLMRRVLVVGAGKAGRTLVEAYRKLNPPPFLIIGFIDDDPAKRNKSYHGFGVLGDSEHLFDLIEEYRISDVVVAITGEIKGETFQTVLDIQERGIEVTRMPIMYEELTQRVPIEHLETDWVIRSFVDQVRVHGLYELLKRSMDILGGFVGTLIFILLLPPIALAIVLETGFPIFYSQPRLGKGASLFNILKFRTMSQNAEADGQAKVAAENDPRVTRVGNFLRKTRLDELPQFWTVLRGEMSLVGPRAERPELVAEYQKQIPYYRARLLVKPGLTGWAQINYGYVATVKETFVKLEYDLYYIKHRTLNMDFSIVLRTIGTVLRRTGR
ncbi:MAG: sugar transferase [Anaerolineales bacterium]|uniref:sugar transferase n=1 Tax=Candidatus Villigracilis vicinus TaxID=3140679 RepID=UPI003137606A|nr:sugar transferase [Anaerolineales bacterium]MBK9781056.1 sugar transferase [Anaerolineales bacterium]